MRTKISKKIFRPAPAAASNERRSNPSITIGDDQSDYQMATIAAVNAPIETPEMLVSRKSGSDP
jgi:hypothetical protein